MTDLRPDCRLQIADCRWKKKVASLSSNLQFVRRVVFLLLAAVLIFCHGCHTEDHDDELGVMLIERR
jgi:hypothetical protein